jgi:phosphoribosylanthranilate isomerase
MTVDDNKLKIKICGITRIEDGLCALEAGADWLGFIRWPQSKRYQPADECAGLICMLRKDFPGSFSAVGVYVDATEETVLQEIPQLGLDRLQFHGMETPAFVSGFSLPVVKALAMKNTLTLVMDAAKFPGIPVLTDTYHPDLPGGTGKGYDYDLLKELIRERDVIIAGGLRPENVGKIIADLKPWGVDVSSRVEIEPGIKDHDKIRRFITEARKAQS